MNAEARLKFWIEEVIIGLDLCPWAGPVYKHGGLHLALSDAASPERAQAEFLRELQALLTNPTRSTTLLAFPQWVLPFPLFFDVIRTWEEALGELELPSAIQLVAFHPEFRFAELSPLSLANWVNRSPYPICHFLRASDVSAALGQNLEQARKLSVRNEIKLTKLSASERKRLFPWLSA